MVSESLNVDRVATRAAASTTVLARKYRPRNFTEMVGQPHVVQALANALDQQRLHHAWLFTGTRGVGKTTVARILAKSLNCTGPDGSGGITSRPCGVCPSCREIDEGRFVDYVELDAASNRGVDEMTQLLEHAAYMPAVGRFKVYLIDEVHMLSGHAFNAMLKTLEEPPGYMKFVLATTDPQKVPATVLSRCLQFNLRPMAPQTIAAHLLTVLDAESVRAEPGALKLIARAARGSMRDALSLTDQAIAFGSGALEDDAVRRMLGAVDRGHAARIVEAVAAGDAAAIVAAVDGLRELGLSAAGTVEETVALLQEMALHQAIPGTAFDEAEPEAAVAARLAPLLAADETQVLYSILLCGRTELALAGDEYGGLTMLLLRMLAFGPSGPEQGTGRTAPARSATPSPLAAAAPVAVETGASAAAPMAATPPPPEAQPSTVLADRWAATVDRMIAQARIGAMVRELAVQAQCIGWTQAPGEGGELSIVLRVERENLRAPALCERLRSALADAWARPVRLSVEPGATHDTPAERHAAERHRRQAEAERTIHDDPLVKALLSQYKTARVVPGSVKPV